jgi:transcriptional regulator with XRE-family HTH domain
MADMVRPPLTQPERDRGERLGRLLRQARGERSMVEVAAAAGLSPETLRKIESGRVPTPAFFTIAALAGALGLSLDALVEICDQDLRRVPRRRHRPAGCLLPQDRWVMVATVTIEAPDASPANKYISGVKLRGRAHTRSWADETLLQRGGTLTFELTWKPDTGWATATRDLPVDTR